MEPEKKKRGRPPGSGKKKEVVGPFNPDKLQREVDEVFSKKPEVNPSHMTIALPDPIDGKTVTIETAKPVTIISRRSTDETPYPSNWHTLSKVDKLQWLTAQKAKR